MLCCRSRWVTNASKRPMLRHLLRYYSIESSEDEEFMFPIHFVMGSRDVFAWSVNQITRDEDFSIAAESFGPSRELIYTSKSLKIMKVDHTVNGITTFGLVKDEADKWKITSIYNFNKLLDSHTVSTVTPCIDKFLSTCNQFPCSSARDILTTPYHLIIPPHALHVRDFFTKIIRFPSSPTFAWNKPPSILLVSEDKCLLEGRIEVGIDDKREVHEVVLMLLCQEHVWKIGSLAMVKV